MLKETAAKGERATGKGPGSGRGNEKASHDATPFPPNLSDLGISRDQSSRYQKLAVIDDFEVAVAGERRK
jgi:hypothetical protein